MLESVFNRAHIQKIINRLRNTPFVTHIGQFRFEGNKGLRMVNLAHSSRKDFELLITCYIVRKISTTVSCLMNFLRSRYWKLNVYCAVYLA